MCIRDSRGVVPGEEGADRGPARVEEGVALVEALAELAARLRVPDLLHGDGVDVAVAPEGVEGDRAAGAVAGLHERARVGRQDGRVGLPVAPVPERRAAAAA